MPILVQNVCFNCRKVFKKPEIPFVYECDAKKRKFYKCPDCGDDLQYMGPKFRAPSKNNVDEWTRIRVATENGADWL
jgi:hypothetical protein